MQLKEEYKKVNDHLTLGITLYQFIGLTHVYLIKIFLFLRPVSNFMKYFLNGNVNMILI
jgi:hypothetical protein